MTETAHELQVIVLLDARHAIFKGHFPGQPVLPGVCMLEMITEIMGKHTSKELRIRSSPLVKFLLMIDPDKNPQIHLNIRMGDPDPLVIEGKIYAGEQTFMKFQLKLEVV